jgi:hypothetical protein
MYQKSLAICQNQKRKRKQIEGLCHFSNFYSLMSNDFNNYFINSRKIEISYLNILQYDTQSQ